MAPQVERRAELALNNKPSSKIDFDNRSPTFDARSTLGLWPVAPARGDEDRWSGDDRPISIPRVEIRWTSGVEIPVTMATAILNDRTVG